MSFCIIKKNYLLLKDGTRHGYDIDRCRLGKENWLSHLREKTWFGKHIEEDFLAAVRKCCPSAPYLPENKRGHENGV